MGSAVLGHMIVHLSTLTLTLRATMLQCDRLYDVNSLQQYDRLKIDNVNAEAPHILYGYLWHVEQKHFLIFCSQVF